MGRTYRGSCPRVANLPDGHRTHWVQRTCRCNRHQRVIRPAAKQLSLSARGTRRGANLRPAFRSAAEGSACGRELAFALRLRVAAKWASGRRIEMSKRQQLIYDFKEASKGPAGPEHERSECEGEALACGVGSHKRGRPIANAPLPPSHSPAAPGAGILHSTLLRSSPGYSILFMASASVFRPNLLTMSLDP
jgi:hypothetical protein